VVGSAVTVIGITAAVLVLIPFRASITVDTAALVLVVPVAIGVAVGGFPVAPLGVVSGFLAYDVFFIPPYGTLRVGAAEHWVSLGVYMAVSLIVGGVVAQAQQARSVADERESEVRVLAEVDRLRSALVAAVSHDLRTPLASIKAAVSDLVDPSVHLADEDWQVLLVTIEEETDRLTRFVANLLDMSRIESGGLQVNRSATPLDELIEDVVVRFGKLFTGPLSLQLPADLPLVDVDYLLVDQLMANLLENVVRHCPPGTALEISARPEGDWVEVSVADSGPGIAPEERDHIFTLYYRAGDNRRGGTGMGLAICRGIVEAHGGRLTIGPTPGGGSTFTFSLPIAEVPSDPAPSTE
jgi:K+-sensing histidine kinase KdpD